MIQPLNTEADLNWVSCPHCGHEFELETSELESQLLKTVRKLERHSGVASTQAIALETSYSAGYIRRQLIELEKRGRIRRIGERKGWKSAA